MATQGPGFSAGIPPGPHYFHSFREANAWASGYERDLAHHLRCGKIRQREYDALQRKLVTFMYEANIYFNANQIAWYTSARQQGKSQALAVLYGGLTQFVNPTHPSRAEFNQLPMEQSFGEITAFRVWRVQAQDVLVSSYKDTIWRAGEIMTADKSPFAGGQHGIHGWKSVMELVEYTKGMLESQCEYDIARDMYYGSHAWAIIGRVALWGEIIEHERGYRAEHARIVSLDDCIYMGDHTTQEEFHRSCGKPRLRWDGQKLEQVRAHYLPDKRKP